MALEQQIQKDIMEAMKAHDEARLNATRGIKSEILLAKTSGAEHDLTDADVLKIIQKLVKQRKAGQADGRLISTIVKELLAR